jgi:hypothetical protein
MADETEDVVLTFLRRLEDKANRVGFDVARLRDDSVAHSRMLDIVQQDTRIIRAAVTDILQQDTRMIRAAVIDIARASLTPGGVEALHADVNRVQAENAELAAKVAALERIVSDLQGQR